MEAASLSDAGLSDTALPEITSHGRGRRRAKRKPAGTLPGPAETAELINALDDFKVPDREKQEVLAAFGAEKGEVTAGSEPGAVNWRRWR